MGLDQVVAHVARMARRIADAVQAIDLGQLAHQLGQGRAVAVIGVDVLTQQGDLAHAATGQGLLNYFLRARNCGAITEAEASATGLTPAEFASRSFLKILEGRRK